MALINNDLYIGEIGTLVKIIRHPGRDTESIILEFNLSDRRALNRNIVKVEVCPSLTAFEKMRAGFWLGYFYAHQVRPLQHTPDALEGKLMSQFNVEELKATVLKILVTTYDMSMEEASDSVEESFKDDPETWHENVVPEQLASALATDDDDE